MVELVCSGRREKRDRKVVDINMGFFVSVDQIQIFFLDQKELLIKMSSLLNVSNASSKSEEISLKDIEVFVGSGEQN